jgi:hypothetical protein
MGAKRLLEHCQAVWRAMYAQAIPLAQVAEQDPYTASLCPPDAVAVWVGHTTKLFAEVGLGSASQYHQVRRAMIAMDCLCLLRRGAGSRLQSVWALLAEPTEERMSQRISWPLQQPRQLERTPPTELIEPDDLAAFLAKSPAERAATLREMSAAGAFLAVRALAQVVERSHNAQAKTAAARTLLALSASLGEYDPWADFGEEYRSELESVHATPGR